MELEIDAIIGQLGFCPTDFAEGLCSRFADDWNLENDEGRYPNWLMALAVGLLAQKGIHDP